ncbi:uncharacterized protein LOC125839851 [Solanum verrucosum]|uniref:uncharacterized protein LOC125839851 n=1 Tax=Solanum verrucosum TaxID=315347 RepID=UPI0020D0631B|nr:uncharacterized protein LOC125839851 [Solanum verrucosum]
MSMLISRVSDFVVKEFYTAILVHDKDISRLMVHAQQIEKEKLKERSRENKRPRNGDANFSHTRSDGHGRPRFNKEKVSNPKPQGGGNGSSLPNCAKCGRNHEGIEGSNACFGCGKMDHKIRDCTTVSKKEGDSRRRAQPYPSSGPSGSGLNAPKKNRFYALQTRGEQEGSTYVVTSMMKIFQLDVYAL